MTTTIMRDSQVGDAWIQQTMAQVPPQAVLGENGQPSGDFLTGPVRLAFPNIFQPQQQQRDDGSSGTPTYNATLLFPPGVDMGVFYQEFYRVCAADFKELYNSHTQQYAGVNSPFHDQAEKAAQYSGYTPGASYFTVSTQYKVQPVDTNRNPIVDPSAIYPGVWCICSVNAYPYKNKRKGVSFGLQTIMKIGDDTPLGGQGADPNKTFAGLPQIGRPPVNAANIPGANPAYGAPQPAAAPYGAPPGALPPGQPMQPPTHLPQPGAAPGGPMPDGSDLF